MLCYDRIDLSKGIDATKRNNSKECMVCRQCPFNHGIKFQDLVYKRNLSQFIC